MEEITISMEEYKELLIIKGKYEELKEQRMYGFITFDNDKHKQLPSLTRDPYKITC